MFNPLKMLKIGSAEKKMLIGGIASSVVYYGNLYAMNTMPAYPAELKNRLEPHLPRNGEIVGSVVSPATFYVVKKVLKGGEKEKVGDMFLGSALYSIPNFVHDVVVNSAYQVGIDTRPAARLPTLSTISKYVAPMRNSMPAAPSGQSKYVISS